MELFFHQIRNQILQLKQLKNQGSCLFPANHRPLTQKEQENLVRQGCWASDWNQVRVSEDFSTDSIHQVHFVGWVFLGRVNLKFSLIENCELATGVEISFCPRIRNALALGPGQLENSVLDCPGKTHYGAGLTFNMGTEAGIRPGTFVPGMLQPQVLQSVEDPGFRKELQELSKDISWNYNILCSNFSIKNLSLGQGIFLGPGTRVQGSLEIVQSTLLSTLEEPTQIHSGTLVRNSLIQEGCHLDSGAQITSSVLLEHSGASRSALIHESVLGPDTHVAEGEVTSSFLGPFVGFHHQSLLIAAWWPEGRGNIGYGANVGSNHTSRQPDQEIRPGEGTFFGLSTCIKFPCNLSQAPYSLIPTALVLPPQRLETPFSLILEEPSSEAPGRHKILPGWQFTHNIYALMRMEAKFAARQKARRHTWDFRIFRPEILEKVASAFKHLKSLPEKPFYTEKDWPGLGKNYLSRLDLQAGLQAYENILEYGLLRLSQEPRLGLPGAKESWIKNLWEELSIGPLSPAAQAQKFIEWEDTLLSWAQKSRERDYTRGQEVFSDYSDFHEKLEEDPFIQQKISQISSWKSQILA